jgi:probable rRNA maturation factor
MRKKEAELEIDVITSCPLWNDLNFDPQALAHSVIAMTLEAADLPPELERAPSREASLMLSSDEEVRKFNREYRGQDKPTNVLSFAALDSEDPDMPVSGTLHIGDLIMAYETLDREAQEMEVSFKDHFTHLLVHGTLHLAGYDHEEEDEASIMESLEISILMRLGIENPYSDEKYMA